MKKKDLILNPYFLSGLALLILNDLILKWHFTSPLTGKLSDFAGLFVLPIFLAYLFPKSKKSIAFIIGFLFILWKSPLSTPVIDFVNSLTFLSFRRIIDYSDLMALMVLPFSHFLLNKANFQNLAAIDFYRPLKIVTLTIAGFAFTATSMVRHELPKGTVYIGKSYTVKMSKDALLNKINDLGYDWTLHTRTRLDQNYAPRQYYQIDQVLLKDKEVIVDTLKNIKFELRAIKENKTEIAVLNVELKEPGNIQDWRYLRSLRRFYKSEIEVEFLNKIKN